MLCRLCRQLFALSPSGLAARSVAFDVISRNVVVDDLNNLTFTVDVILRTNVLPDRRKRYYFLP
jgi:hypothetical protein